MKIYVVEVVLDYCVQCGFSLSRKKAQEKADELNKNVNNKYHKYFVTEYEVKNNSDYCEFDCN